MSRTSDTLGTPTLALFTGSNPFSYILDRVKMPWTTSKENQSNDGSASESATTKSSRWNRKRKGSVSVTAGGSKPASTSSSAADGNSSDSDSSGSQSQDRSTPKGYTPPKGHATPKRNDVERQKGVRKTAYKAPETPAEARKQRKELKNSMSKEEYKALKRKQRDERARERERNRERMMSGDERYLMDRDRGPERRLIRDWVDSRRLFANTFMPIVVVLLILMFVTTATRSYLLNNLLSMVGMILLILIVLDGVLSGRRVSRFVRERHPDTALSTWSMGFYAFSRASMIRRFRTPRPQVNIGDNI